MREQVAVALVGLLGGRVAGVLADRPRPLAVHLGVDAAREGELARLAEVEVRRQVVGAVDRLDLDARVGEPPRVVRADDRGDGEVRGVLVVDGHGGQGTLGPRVSRMSLFPILTTRDLGAALGFYRDLLGVTVTYEFPGAGRRAGLRRARAGPVAPRHRARPGADRRPERALQPLGLRRRLRRDGRAAACRRASPIVEEPADQPWGERIARVLDPDGNIVILGQR